MRLIDAEALIERLEKSHSYHARTPREEVLLYRDIRIIGEQPTIEAKLVVHAHWKHKILNPHAKNGNHVPYYNGICSNCGLNQGIHCEKQFCYRCGALIDGTDTNVGSKKE